LEEKYRGGLRHCFLPWCCGAPTKLVKTICDFAGHMFRIAITMPGNNMYSLSSIVQLPA
jgi:hypothetical protein